MSLHQDMRVTLRYISFVIKICHYHRRDKKREKDQNNYHLER